MLRVVFFLACFVISLFSCGAAAKSTPPTPKYKSIKVDDTRTIWLKGHIDDDVADTFITNINNIDESDQTKPIYIIINSPGGSLDAGFRMQDNTDLLRAPTICVVEDQAASMASAIFLHCGTRYMQPHSTLMFHFGSLNLQGPRYEVAREFEHAMKQFDEFDADNAMRLGMSLEDYKKWIEHDQWLTQDQALAKGIITDIIAKPRVKPPVPTATELPIWTP